jgi:hypothetical protein
MNLVQMRKFNFLKNILLAICYLTVEKLIRFHKTLLICSQNFTKFSHKLLYKSQNEFELCNQSVKW